MTVWTIRVTSRRQWWSRWSSTAGGRPLNSGPLDQLGVQERAGRRPNAVPHRARAALDADRRAGDGIDVRPHHEAVEDALALELRGELPRLYREVAVRLGVVIDDGPGDDASGVEPDQDVNRTVIRELVGRQVGRPEDVAHRLGASAGRRIGRIRLPVERRPSKPREGHGGRHDRLEVLLRLGVGEDPLLGDERCDAGERQQPQPARRPAA